MLKSVLTMILALFLLLGATFAEQITVQNTFDDFCTVIEQTQSKLSGESPSKLDADALEASRLDTPRRDKGN